MRIPRFSLLRGLVTGALLAFGVLVTSSPIFAQGPPPGFQEAVQKFQAQDFAGAIKGLLEVTGAAPDFPNAWILLGRSYLATDDTRSAHDAFARAREIPAAAGNADFFDGVTYAAEGDMDAAFEALFRAKESGQVNMTNVGLSKSAASLRADRRYRDLFPSAGEYADPFVEDVQILRDWVGEAPGDQFGWVARNVGDLDGDGIFDVGSTSPTWGTGQQGRIYIFSSGSGALLWTADGESGDQLGWGIGAAGDVDLDGTPDVAAGAPGGGFVRIFSGLDGSVIRTITDSAGIGFGSDVANIGDVDGDGHPDLFTGAGTAKDGAGVARVYSGRDGSVLWERYGDAGEGFGNAIAAWGRDGHRLLVVGAPNAGQGNRGITYVFKGMEQTPAFEIRADSSGTQNGAMFVSVLGDVDGDGTPDVYSSDWSDGALGPQTGRIYVHSGATGERLIALGGETAGEGFGIGVADAGDVDNDGLADLVIGSWQYGGAAISGGRIYVYAGRGPELLYSVTGKVPGETFGFDATGIGDVNGDGWTDLLLTSAWSGINGTRSGRTLIIAGKAR